MARRFRITGKEKKDLKGTILSLTFSLIVALGVEKLLSWFFEVYLKIQEPSAGISMVVIGTIGMVLYFLVF